MKRRGFALLTVLWVMLAATLLALGFTRTARADVDASRNRADAARASWSAFGCVERVRAATDALLGAARSQAEAGQVWRELDRLIDRASLDGCDVSLEAAGARLDINSATSEQVEKLFRNVGMADPAGMANRVLDWRDADDMPRERGAEYDSYQARGARLPRNGPLTSVAELRFVQGWEDIPGLDTLLSVEPGRVALNSASLAVLATLPGFTDEAVQRVALDRGAGRPLTNLLVLAASLPRAAADSIAIHFQELAPRVTVEPDAWIVTARAQAGSPPLVMVEKARIVRDDRHHIVAWRRGMFGRRGAW